LIDDVGYKLDLGVFPLTFRNPPILVHGYFMWFAWTIFAVVQLWTGRYLVHWWKWRVIIHSVSGGIIALLTVIAAFVILAVERWHLNWHHIHSVSGHIYTVLGLLLVI